MIGFTDLICMFVKPGFQGLIDSVFQAGIGLPAIEIMIKIMSSSCLTAKILLLPRT